TVRDAWAELQTTGSTEGVAKTAVLKSVLSERADLFEFAGDTIELTEAAQMMNPTDGLPANILTADGGLMEEWDASKGEDGDAVVIDAAPGEAPRAVGQVG
ncbi:slc43a2, partial [Symbiodinium necroappetens]